MDPPSGVASQPAKRIPESRPSYADGEKVMKNRRTDRYGEANGPLWKFDDKTGEKVPLNFYDESSGQWIPLEENDPLSQPNDLVWDPVKKQYRNLGEMDPGKADGRDGLMYAIDDPYSDLSSSYYWGGDPDYAGDQYDYYTRQADAAANRGSVAVNTDMMYRDSTNAENDPRVAALAAKNPTGAMAMYGALTGGRVNTSVGSGGLEHPKADGSGGIYGRQKAQLEYLQGIAAGTTLTPAQRQLLASQQANQNAITSQLASTRGGGIVAAAANSAARFARENADRTGYRNMNVLKAAESDAALGQIGSLTEAMRNTNQTLEFGKAGVQQKSRAQNIGQSIAMSGYGLGALKSGIEGSIARDTARQKIDADDYAEARAKYDFDTKINQGNINAGLGVAKTTATEVGRDWTALVETKKKKESDEP